MIRVANHVIKLISGQVADATRFHLFPAASGPGISDDVGPVDEPGEDKRGRIPSGRDLFVE